MRWRFGTARSGRTASGRPLRFSSTSAIDGPGLRRTDAKGDRGVHVGLEVDEQHRAAHSCERRGDVDGGRRLADAAIGIEGRDDHQPQVRLPKPAVADLFPAYINRSVRVGLARRDVALLMNSRGR